VARGQQRLDDGRPARKYAAQVDAAFGRGDLRSTSVHARYRRRAGWYVPSIRPRAAAAEVLAVEHHAVVLIQLSLNAD
jgi:hypothetical protein